MGNQTLAHQQELINTLGHAAGVIVFGIFLALLLRQRSRESLRRNRLPLIAVGLALFWNLTSLAVLAPGVDETLVKPLFAAVGFSVLSALPAVLLHLSFEGRFRACILAGYALSVVSTSLHLAELAFPDATLHRAGLSVITLGFSLLTVLTVALSFRQSGEQRRLVLSRALAAMGLILLSASFAHFAEGHADNAWSAELAFHHAGIPLALFIILQNQRFLLLDAFIRFLANVFLAGVFAYLLIRTSAAALAPAAGGAPGASFRVAITLVGGCLILVAYAWLSGKVERLLAKWWFAKPDLPSRLRAIRELAAASPGDAHFLRNAEAIIAETMDTRSVDSGAIEPDLIGALESAAPALPLPAADVSPQFERSGIEAIVPLRLGATGARYLLLGARKGGRRYLSDDLAALATLAGEVSGQIEQLHQAELRRLVTVAELRALQAQIHPHFLFNALNTLYGVIPREAKGARKLVLNLSDVLRYFFRAEKSFISLEEELNVIQSYLEIEKLRLGEKLTTEFDIDPAALAVSIPVLSIEPLIENAIKHGVAVKPEGGRVKLTARIEGDALEISVEDTGAGFSGERSTAGHGVGLSNVERRLAICYGPAAKLEIESTNGRTRVGFRVPAPQPVIANP